MLIQIHEGGPPHARTFTWICKWLEVTNITSLFKMQSGPRCFKFPRTPHALWRAFQSDIQGQFFAEGCGRSKKEAKNASAKVQLTDTSFHLLYIELKRSLRWSLQKLIEQLDLSLLPDVRPNIEVPCCFKKKVLMSASG